MPRHGRSTVAVAGLVALLAAAPAAWPGTGTSPAPSAAGAAPVRWSGVVFSADEELAAWLAARGSSYEDWAATHPLAARRLERGVRLPERRTALGLERVRLPVAAAASSEAASAPAPPALPAPAPPEGPAAAVLVPLGAGLALAFGLLVLVAVTRARPVRALLGGGVSSHRVELGAAAFSVALASAVGVAIALTAF